LEIFNDHGFFKHPRDKFHTLISVLFLIISIILVVKCSKELVVSPVIKDLPNNSKCLTLKLPKPSEKVGFNSSFAIIKELTCEPCL